MGVDDLDARGLLDSTLVLMLGEFGRSPVLTKERGREHWTPVMAMLAAGGTAAHFLTDMRYVKGR